MILSNRQIAQAIKDGSIVIDPLDWKQLNPNSYNLRLAPQLITYDDVVLDMCREPRVERHVIPPEGMVLYPGRLYLGLSLEYTETHNYVPMIEGRSSIGRLGMAIHITAGFGDKFFSGRWTFEITVVHPLRIYAGVEAAQICYHEIEAAGLGYSGKYGNVREDTWPKPSGLWREFGEKSQPLNGRELFCPVI